MGARDPRVDAYIERSAEFAQPILRHIRETVHATSPDIEETMKWSFPHFMYHGIVCSMASFKEHCALVFWRRDLVTESANALDVPAMGQFGRLRAVEDLPHRDVLLASIREVMRRNEAGEKKPRRAAPAKPQADEIPASFRQAIEENPAAAEHFGRFTPSQRREYVEWVVEAKREDTRRRRIATAVEWIADGKRRNWKYLGK